MKVIGIILAAGQSRRMGMDKLSLPVGKRTMVSTVIDTAAMSNLTSIKIVTAMNNRSQTFAGHSLIPCRDSIKGQSHSLRCGVEEAERQGADAIVVLLADQPFIQTNTINALLEMFKNNGELDFVASRFKGIAQPPVLFSKKAFTVIKQLRGDKGAGVLIKGPYRLPKGMYIDYKDPKILADIDTKEVYTRYCLDEGRTTHAATIY
ncbi:nucleotidyltransferase family protein [Alkalicoccobacillus porphyridii]|uniref:Xanthine dehydrogenase n=1 Tax=Alkalicoccobacillus porphyridii TaxID=2597270 RepID=A0A554A3Q0_9BACI|nr:nucleotidyltransferase family protein [Alkalicoccobacillus porphyridii]TSB48313.1 xanthine dehydrogenase [Alkalicoccobacillus porphyridii]